MRWLVSGMLVLLFVAGCALPLSTEQWLSCEKLSNASSIDIPDCASQDECVQKANSTLFFFEKQTLSLPVQQKLSSYANHIGASWYYTNKAKKEAVIVGGLCAGRNAEALPEHVNALRFWLGGSIQEIDSANADLVELLALEEQALETDGVSSIPEEPLFQTRIEIASVLNDFSGTIRPSMELGKNVFESTQKLDSFAKALGLSGARVSEVSSVDLLQKYGGTKISETIARTILTPQWSPIVAQSLAFLTDFRKLQDSISSLGNAEPFQVFLAIEQSVGVQGSSAAEVSRMFSEDARNRSSAFLRLQDAKSVTGENIQDIELRISGLADSIGALSSSSVSLLSADQIQGIAIGRGGDGNVLQDWVNRLQALKWKSFQVSSQESSRSISFGESLQQWKQLEGESQSFGEELRVWEEESLSQLEDACLGRMQGAERELKEVVAESLSPIEVENFSAVKGKISVAKNSRTLRDCVLALESFEHWTQAEQTLAVSDINSSSSLYTCASFVQKAFDSDWPLYPLKPQFLAFQEFSRTHSGSEIVFACFELQRNVQEFVQSTSEFLALQRVDTALSQKFDTFSFFESTGLTVPDGVASAKKSWQGLSLHALSGWDWEILFLKGPQVVEKLSELEARLQPFFEDAANLWISRNVQWRLLGESLIVDSNSSTLLEARVQNPSLTDWNGLFRFQAFPDAVLESGVGVLVAEKENKFVLFSRILRGDSFWKIRTSSLRAETFSTKPAYVDLEKVWVSKTFHLSVPSSFSNGKISVQLSLPDGAREASADIPFSRLGNILELEWPLEKTRAEAQWKQDSPLTVVWKDGSVSTDQNSFSFSASLQLSNDSVFDLSRTPISLPFPETGSLDRVQLSDETGNPIPAKALPNSVFSFSLSDFAPFSSRTLFVRAQGEDGELFWRSLWEQSQRSLSSLTELSNLVGVEAREFQSAHAWLSGEFSSEHQNELLDVWSSIQSLQVRAAQLKGQEEDFDFRAGAVQKKLDSLREALDWFAARPIDAREWRQLFDSSRLSLSSALESKDSDIVAALDFLSSSEQALGKWNGLQNWLQSQKETFEQKSAMLSSNQRTAFGSKFQHAITFQDWNSAWTALQDWNESLSLSERSMGEELQQAFEQVQTFSQLAQNNPRLNALRNLLVGTTAKQLEEVDYLLPSSKEKLKELEQRLKALYKQGMSKEVQSFIASFKSGDFSAAQQHWNSASDLFSQAFEEAQSIDSLLKSDFEQIRSDAQTAVESAQSKIRATSNPDPRLLQLADKAESAFEKGDFLNAIRYARLVELAASGTNSQNLTGLFGQGLPLTLAPLLGLIALAAYFRWGRKKDAVKEAEKKKALEAFEKDLE